MKYYFDVTLLPDSEFPTTVLMNAVYTKLHKALIVLSESDIGVSFPQYKRTLGDVLRVHGGEQKLGQLIEGKWLGGMQGYCRVSELTLRPEKAKYRTVSRKQPNMSQSKLKRLLKRGSITETEANQYRIKMVDSGLDEPFLVLNSSSNGHKHRRYIEIGDLRDDPSDGSFDTFGLSKTATIPWF